MNEERHTLAHEHWASIVHNRFGVLMKFQERVRSETGTIPSQYPTPPPPPHIYRTKPLAPPHPLAVLHPRTPTPTQTSKKLQHVKTAYL